VLVRKQSVAAAREQILRSIVVIRGQKVILDRHLAAMYEVPAGALIQAVKRNSARFPGDFMFSFIARVQKLEITNCDLKFVGWTADCTLRIHRAGRELGRRIEAMEKRTDDQFVIVFDAIRALIKAEAKPKRRVGYLTAGKPTPC
jgi:hypothetical protein